MPYKNKEDRRKANKRSYQKHRLSVLAKQKAKRDENIDEFREKRKEYYEKNKDKISEHNKNYYDKNKERYRQQHRDYMKSRRTTKEQKEYEREYERTRYETDVQYRLKKNCRSRMYNALRGISKKSAKTEELIGCTFQQLKEHIESQFTEGMSWERMGDIHVDHIRPCASFDLTDPEQQKECFNYKNLQPLWAKDNLEKSDTWVDSKK